MRRIQLVAIAACMTVAACGGTSTEGQQSASTSMPAPQDSGSRSMQTGTSPAPAANNDEINESNALLIASVADVSLGRYLQYREALQQISSIALAYTPPVPTTSLCGAPPDGGQLQVKTIADSSYIVTPESCRLPSNGVMDAGTVEVDNYSSAGSGSTVTFSAKFNALHVQAAKSVAVSGTANYGFSISGTASDSVDVHHESADLDFVQANQIDQYRDWRVTSSQPSSIATSGGFILNLENVIIKTSRVAVSPLTVSTPSPVTITPSGQVSGSVLAVSSKDGSRAQFDYLDLNTVRLRSWSSSGALLLDTVKKADDADVRAVETVTGG